MTITDTRPAQTDGAALADAPGDASAGGLLPDVGGLGGWLTTADPRRTGRLMMTVAALFGVASLVVWTLLGVERFSLGLDIFERLTDVRQVESLAVVSMVFLVALPLMLGLAIALVPDQVGARTIAFPRAVALAVWSWIAGSGIVIASYLGNGGPYGGESELVALFLVGLGLTVMSLLVVAVCLAATVLTLRSPDRRIDELPAFSFATLVASLMALLSLPVLIGNLALLYVDYQYQRIAFSGNQGINGQIDWTWSQPAVYLLGIMGLGVAADTVPLFARRPTVLRGAVFSGIGLFGAASFGAWTSLQYNDRDVPTSPVAIGLAVLALVGVLAVLGPLALTLRQGRIKLGAPLLFALATLVMSLVTVAFGALTHIDPLNVIGTTWEEGVFLYVVLGMALLPAMGAVALWGHRLWGRGIPNGAASGLALLALGGVVLSAFPDMVLGFVSDQALGEVNVDHEDASQILNVLHGLGLALTTLVALAFVLLAAKAFTGAPTADAWAALSDDEEVAS
jgi:heme/copper-type cytochrome/quinol oxidase subunit 1